jgi:hypothetical protein
MLSALTKCRNKSFSDYQQLEYAVSEGRAIVTFNAGDFDRLHKEYINNGKNHFGIILSKQIQIGELTKRLAKFLFSHSSEEMKNNIFWL